MNKMFFLAMLFATGLLSNNAIASGTADLAGLQFGGVAEQLNLSEKQKQKVNVIMKEYGDTTLTVRNEMQLLQNQMRNIDFGKIKDSQLSNLGDETGRLTGEYTEAMLRAQAKFYRLLTKKQRSKFKALRDKKTQGK